MMPSLASISTLLLFLSISLSRPAHGKYLRSRSISSSRILEDQAQVEGDANDADYAYVEEEAAEVESYEDWMAEVSNATDDRGQMIVNDSIKDENNDATDGSKQGNNIIMAQVENLKGKAETSAWAFWSSPPSEWDGAQWDMLFITIAALSVTLCCLAGCFAYCCVAPVEDDEKGAELKDGKSIRRPKFKLRRRRMILRRQSSGASTVTSRTSQQSSRRQISPDARSQSTADSHSEIKSMGSLEIEDDKEKPLLQQNGLIKNISRVRSLERVRTLKKESGSQRSNDQSAKTEPSTSYTRMKV